MGCSEMGAIGFTSWVVAKNDYAHAIDRLNDLGLKAIELSVLRETELPRLLSSLESLDFCRFSHVSVHAPGRLKILSERDLVTSLEVFTKRGWPIVVHPNVIEDINLWRKFDSLLYIENMDKRKRVARTYTELTRIFEKLPDASLCFDLAHARQIDPTLREAMLILKGFKNRIREIHISEVNTFCGHTRLSYGAFLAYQQLSHLIPDDAPVIIESICSSEKDSLTREVLQVQRALQPAA